MTEYATQVETEAVMRKPTDFERWLNRELDRIAPNRFEMGASDGIYELMQELWIEKGRP